jgi:hypothetical protein
VHETIGAGYESLHKCRAGNATWMKRSMQDDVNGPISLISQLDFKIPDCLLIIHRQRVSTRWKSQVGEKYQGK